MSSVLGYAGALHGPARDIQTELQSARHQSRLRARGARREVCRR